MPRIAAALARGRSAQTSAAWFTNSHGTFGPTRALVPRIASCAATAARLFLGHFLLAQHTKRIRCCPAVGISNGAVGSSQNRREI
jgi:hypothetical protein